MTFCVTLFYVYRAAGTLGVSGAVMSERRKEREKKR